MPKRLLVKETKSLQTAAARREAVAGAIAKALRSPRLTSSQIGKICEKLVWEAAMWGSNGRIVPYPPYDDNEGTDGLLKRRYRPATIAVQVKGRLSQRPNGAFELSVDARDIPRSDPKRIVVVHLPKKGPRGQVTVWVFSSATFRRLASFSVGKYQALLSPSPTARDRWISYRRDVYELAEVFGKLLDREARLRRLRRRRRSGE